MSDSSTYTPTAGQPIPTPADFPVSWEDPADAKLTWVMDNHATEPMAALICSVSKAFLRGFNSAFSQLGMPIQLRVAFINGFPYVAAMPTATPPEVVMKTIGAVNRVAPAIVKLLIGRMAASMEKHQLEKLDPILARLDSYWQDELLPEINQHHAYFESCDLRGLSLEQLRAHFAESLKRTERLAELHMRATSPAMAAMGLFEELYCELFEGATSLDAMRLLQGFDNQSLAGDRMLWDLSRAALTIPSVRQVLAQCAAADVIPALEGSSEGRRFLADLRAYLNQYGQRFNVFSTISEPSWIEDPTPAIECLKAYITRTEGKPEAEQAWLAAGREKAVAEARARLAGYPQPVVTRFETLLKAAQSSASIKEDSHWAILPSFYQMRRMALEFGRRLADAHVLETADDVFYLTGEELLDGEAARSEEKSTVAALRRRVRERKAQFEHFRHITPPPMLGTRPAFEPPDGGPIFRAVGSEMRVTGGSGDSQELKGEAGSPGIVRGTARVIHSLAETGKLQAGDVLVTERTLPPWTPLFATAAAVVTDYGGVLSHCAIVAREYHIPAVVGTGRATKTFHDGQLLEVDGDAGRVRVIPSLGEE
jgi:phosphohistidine swiveling domain-containing protein